MKKALLLVLTFAAFFPVDAAMGSGTLLVQFSNGNQIFGSTLQIFSDGTVIRRERSCCPPKNTPVPEHPLNAREISDLIKDIANAKAGPTVLEKGNITTDGSVSGFLVVYPGGPLLMIHSITRNALGQPDRVTFNRSPAARAIEALVDGFVKYPLYRGF